MPPGSLAAMADASEAFRVVGAAKDQWPGLVILAPSGWFIIDTRLPFGLASATGVWGSVADATLAIIHAHFDTEVGLRAVKWVDDFVFMKPPSSDLLLDNVLAVTEPLGFPWHPEKRSEFASEVRYLGFEFNVHTFVVKLPEDKAAKYRERAVPFTKSGHVRLKDVERVFGCLQHIVIMARDLGPHLADFAEFLGVFDRDDLFQYRFIPARVQDEAKVWLKALGSPLRRSFAAPGPPFHTTSSWTPRRSGESESRAERNGRPTSSDPVGSRSLVRSCGRRRSPSSSVSSSPSRWAGPVTPFSSTATTRA
ncbi:hypothetical protein A4X06_0g8954 [Tilletia controversa]|uniref:Reverse transcriptase domain-containing protein n=1 Tax=Tilletia controversa TaxID=13291 RepID=A0A8X7MJ62_9BASI|nr:hypothetical protein A4X06_0g8954 [Tilletia controversa]